MRVAPEYKEGRLYKWTLLVTQVIMALATVVGIVVALRTLNDLNQNIADSHTQAVAAATQAATSKRQLELSQRPWIAVDSVDYLPSPLPKRGEKKSLYPVSIKATFKNYGSTVANDAKVIMRASCQIADGEDWLSETAKDICSESTRGMKLKAVFPNKTSDITFAFPGCVAPIAQPNFIIGCVVYGDPLQACDKFENCHWSRFVRLYDAKPEPHVQDWSGMEYMNNVQ
jgi:hypothetical protein